MNSKAFSPVRLLVDLNFAAKVWFGLFLLVTLCEAATLGLLLHPQRVDPKRVLFVASNGRGYSGDVAELGSLTNLHVRIAEDVILTFFNRTPTDFDHPERIDLLFLPEAARQARADCEQDAQDLRTRQLRQKPEVDRLQYLEASNERILVTVFGQLVQAGVFNGQPLVNALPFQMDLELVPNPNLILNAAFPLVVKRFRYEIKPR